MPADVVDAEDVGMVERRGRARFLLESRQAIGFGARAGRQHLDRDVAPEPRIARAIHFPMPPAAEGARISNGPRRVPGVSIQEAARRLYRARIDGAVGVVVSPDAA